jgi:hypothetical protein
VIDKIIDCETYRKIKKMICEYIGKVIGINEKHLDKIVRDIHNKRIGR